MEPATVNTFLDRFIAVADSGFGLIQGDVSYVLNALIVISIVLAGVQWTLAQEAPLAPFFRKVLFVGFFAFLVNNWASLSSIIVRSGAELGLAAGGGAMSMADLHNPGRVGQIGVEMYGRTIALQEGMNFFSDGLTMLLIFVAALSVALGFFVLAIQIFVSLIAFKLGALAAFVALPWGVFNGTSWIAERPLGWVAGSAVRFFVLALVASISIQFVETLPPSFVLDDGGGLQVLFFGLTVLALAWFAPQLASEVVQGQPHLSGADAVRGALGAGFVAYHTPGAVVGAATAPFRFVGGVIGAGGKAIGMAGQVARAFDRGGARQSPAIDHSQFQPPQAPSNKGRS